MVLPMILLDHAGFSKRTISYVVELLDIAGSISERYSVFLFGEAGSTGLEDYSAANEINTVSHWDRFSVGGDRAIKTLNLKIPFGLSCDRERSTIAGDDSSYVAATRNNIHCINSIAFQ
jgi:hypothetical protein